MDGILLVHREQETLLQVFDNIIKTLQKWGLHVAPENVQTTALLPF